MIMSYPMPLSVDESILNFEVIILLDPNSGKLYRSLTSLLTVNVPPAQYLMNSDGRIGYDSTEVWK